MWARTGPRPRSAGRRPRPFKRVIDRGGAGDTLRRRKERRRNYEDVADLVAERVQRSKGWISAKRLLPSARMAGYTGSDRNFRRLVAAAKKEWRGTHHRGRRPAVWTPGEHLVIDWGVIAGVHVRCCPGRWRWCPTPGTCSDVGAIAGALWAIHLAARPASGAWTFGWKRAEIISAAGNGITLLVVSAVVAFEAIRRLVDPPPVDGGPVLVVALIGVAVNVIAAWVLAKANRSSLNVEGAYQHILTDLYGFIGTVIAGIVILTTG